MRYIKLEASSRQELENIYRTHFKPYIRQRAHSLLLSDRGYSIPDIAKLYSTRTHTVRAWFNRWEANGIAGLQIRPGRGLKSAINIDHTAFVDSIKEEVSLNPHTLRDVVERLNAKWGTSLTVLQVKSFLKKTEVQMASFP
jgi:transposase